MPGLEHLKAALGDLDGLILGQDSLLNARHAVSIATMNELLFPWKPQC